MDWVFTSGDREAREANAVKRRKILVVWAWGWRWREVDRSKEAELLPSSLEETQRMWEREAGQLRYLA